MSRRLLGGGVAGNRAYAHDERDGCARVLKF